ncbi:signal peptidase I [Halospeciosus flavus]|uniref:Signal peptidase I n=1 Tax=Halospeciosus flavus TaxID=3032283 RepID=A0ABD5Z380_9EURY|nr:signal peptidase I [Halospeciosus flavus]
MRPKSTVSRFDRRTLTNVVGLLVVCALVLPFVVYAVPATVGAQQSYVVLSGSMEPAISVGDVVLVSEVTDPAALAVGDVITFSRGGDVPITHRITDIVQTENGLVFETKGDANEDADPGTVASSQVIGLVVFTIPFIGYVVEFVGTTTGFLILVVAPFALLAVLELRDWVATRRDGGDDHDHDQPGNGAVDSTITEAQDDATPGDSVPDDTLAFTGADLTLGSIAFGLFAIYAGYIAYLVRTTWAFTVVAAAVGLFVLLTAVKFQSFGTVETTVSTDGGIEPAHVIDGEWHVTGGRPIVSVASQSALHTMAATDDRWVVRDDDVEYLFDDAVVFCADVEYDEAERTANTAAETDSEASPDAE